MNNHFHHHHHHAAHLNQMHQHAMQHAQNQAMNQALRAQQEAACAGHPAQPQAMEPAPHAAGQLNVALATLASLLSEHFQL